MLLFLDFGQISYRRKLQLNDFALFEARPVPAYRITLRFGEKAIFTKLPSYSQLVAGFSLCVN
jgi:hypothetical protein